MFCTQNVYELLFKKQKIISSQRSAVTSPVSIAAARARAHAWPLPSPPLPTPLHHRSRCSRDKNTHARSVTDLNWFEEAAAAARAVRRRCCREVARAARAHHSSSLLTGGLLEFKKNKLHQTLIFLDFGCFYEFLSFTDQRLRVSNSSQRSAQQQDCSFIYLLYFSVQLK